MRYEFAKGLYSLIDYEKDKSFWESEQAVLQAGELVKRFNDGNFSTVAKWDVHCIKRLCEDMKNIHDKCLREDGSFKSRREIEGAKRLSKYKELFYKMSDCMCIYFFLTENNLYNDDRVTLYETLINKAGFDYDETVYPYMKDMIFAYVLETGQDFDVYLSLMQDWEYREKKAQLLNLPVLHDIGELTFYKWEEILDSGMEEVENEKRTKLTMVAMLNDFDDLLADEKKIGKKTIEEVFPKSIVERVMDTENRRRWYFFRILEGIIARQIDEIIDSIIQYRSGKKGVIERLKQLMKECWLEKGTTDYLYFPNTWSKVASSPKLLENYSEEQIREELYHSKVVPGKIIKSFKYYFDGYDYEDIEDGCAFAPYEVRAMLHGIDIDKELPELEKMTKMRAAESIMRKILTGDNRKVTKELLLMTVLYAKLMGIEMEMSYVTNNVLYNSRFSRTFSDSLFDSYFQDMFEQLGKMRGEIYKNMRIDCFRRNAWDVEEDYLDKGIAVFNEILLGKEIN